MTNNKMRADKSIMMSYHSEGMIQVYTGDGKGKTTAALGLALRAIGHGRKVFMIQFMKGEERTGELIAAEKLAPLLTIKPMGRKGFVNQDNPNPEDKLLAKKALDYAKELILSQAYDIIILDEVNVAVAFGLLPVGAVLELINLKPKALELVLTGRFADPKILEKADLVTEMKNQKHYFEKGVSDRVSIER
jgi:cob(I)alamin adenosyltransferase